MAAPAEHVAAGAKFLDESSPDWWRNVSTADLDLGDCSYCVLGQLAGDYDDGLLEFGLDDDQAVELGFMTRISFGDLTAEWCRVIEARRAAA